MSELRENVRQVLVKLVPASVINDISCFVFYDNHPKDATNIDVTVCTKKGEVKEFYQRDLVGCIKLGVQPSEIKILRNKNCDLYYLVAAKENLIILSRKVKLEVHVKLSSVESYDISDISCCGQASLRVFCKGDAVPLLFTENYEKQNEFSETFTSLESDESFPIISQLKRKLTEAKYSVKFNEKTYKDFLNIRQAVAFSAYKKIHPNFDDLSIDGSKEIASALKITMQTPWIKVYNNKIVIAINVLNLSNETLEDVHIILHSTIDQSVEYTTKLFTPTDYLLHWEDKPTQTIEGNINTAIVVVIEIDELKTSVVSNINFNGVVYYKKMGKEFLLPIGDVYVSSMDTMAEEFDVLSSGLMDTNSMLAVLASTEKTDLTLRHIKQTNDEALTLDDFCTYLQMDRVQSSENIAIYRKSPYHVLYGVMIVLHGTGNSNCLAITVYSRTPSQVLALIHYIHDVIPYTIVTTTPNHKITAKDSTLSEYNEDVLEDTQQLYMYQNYITSITARSKLVMKYLDDSLLKMNESKNPVIQSKIGSEVDIFAGGEAAYLEFKKRMRDEANKAVDSINQVTEVNLSEEMCID